MMAIKGQKGKARKKRGIKFIPYDYEAAYKQNIEKLHEVFVDNLVRNRLKCVYALKEVRAGEQLDIEIYPEFRRISDVPEEGRIKKDNSAAQKNLNDKNAIKHVERSINENFGEGDIWITMNYGPGEEPKDMGEATRNMRNFIGRVNYERKKQGLGNAKYIYITEYSPEEKIRWHHHLIMDGGLDMDTVEKKWKKGKRNRIRRLDKDEFGLAGMANYITKNKNRKKGERRWNSSKNLRPYKTRKVHSKRKEGNAGRYIPIEKYVDRFVKDRDSIEEQVKKWFPDYIFTESAVYYNDFNGLFYVRAKMRKEERRKERKIE